MLRRSLAESGIHCVGSADGSFARPTPGQLAPAKSLTRGALALDRRIFGERHAYVAASLSNL
jgi:hypothetical protein